MRVHDEEDAAGLRGAQGCPAPLALDVVRADADPIRVAERLLGFGGLNVVVANVCLVVLIPVEQVTTPASREAVYTIVHTEARWPASHLGDGWES